MSTLADQLKQITSALDDLRSQPPGRETRNTLDLLFRRTHNLKAAAAADGLYELSSAAHELESVLHSLRTGNTALDDDVLQQLTERSTSISDNLPPIPTEIWNSLKAEEKHTLSQAIKEGARIFLVQTSFDVADFDQQFQKLKQILTSTGEVISIAPQTENNKINFRIIYAGNLPLELGEIANVTTADLLRRESITFATVVHRAVRGGESAAVALGKTIKFEIRNDDLLLDESLCNAIADPLLHLVRNAVDHGIEREGKITIEAALTQSEFKLTVSDDGRGIDPEIIASGKLFEPGFSTASHVSELSGRGVGLDVVKTAIEEAGGSINVISQPGEGSTFEIILPRMNAD